MAVIGVGYFPMFAGLALDSLVSLAVTFLYACVLLAVDIYKIFECELIPVSCIRSLAHFCLASKKRPWQTA
ncbi:hypothetical protein DPMN_137970 [Dreissena polymorpha]|uniref:Uncharacterized protein n=1 Tax=Dreissena polymorpha TaxID=45954 RepID=A0A9D4G3F5_DREPO|nr:hypothetical protein DPMN_137970 [Dreissena polymorpha]